MPGAVVTGWGIAVPDKIVTNEDLSARLDTSDAWITERTGIRERHIGGTTSELAIVAGRQALARAGRTRRRHRRARPRHHHPRRRSCPGPRPPCRTGSGSRGGAFDLNAACSGFVYALVVAHGLVLAGARRVLVIGSETLSRITDWDDRTLAVIVGDGAGAVVLEATDGPGELLAWDLGADGSLRHLLKCDHGGYLYMNGKEIFRHAVRAVVDSSLAALGRAGLEPGRRRPLRPPPGQRPHHHRRQRAPRASPTSAAWSPSTATATPPRRRSPWPWPTPSRRDCSSPGARCCMSGFGGGMTWASAVLRWGG